MFLWRKARVEFAFDVKPSGCDDSNLACDECLRPSTLQYLPPQDSRVC